MRSLRQYDVLKIYLKILQIPQPKNMNLQSSIFFKKPCTGSKSFLWNFECSRVCFRENRFQRDEIECWKHRFINASEYIIQDGRSLGGEPSLQSLKLNIGRLLE